MTQRKTVNFTEKPTQETMLRIYREHREKGIRVTFSYPAPQNHGWIDKILKEK